MMRPDKTYNINQLRDYSSLFSRSEVMRWYKSDWSSLRTKIDRYDPSLLKKHCSYLTYLKRIYKILEKEYPNEYVYKNEFINKWLLRELGESDSIVFNELRLGKAIADLAMFNGVSKVFEIKTLLDREARLSNQLEQYCRLFNEVYLIVPETKSNLYLKRNPTTGIIAYDQTNRSFSLIREASYNEEIDATVLMEVVHTHEYMKIVEEYYGSKPQVNDFNKFGVCKDLISQIPSPALSKLFVKLMKTRRIHNEFSRREYQFNQLFLSMNYTTSQKHQLLSNLSTIIS